MVRPGANGQGELVIEEFKDFINRGNVIELAVAFVLGVAFKPIIDAIVGRVLMPIVGLIVGQPNFDAVGTFACDDGLDPATNIVTGSEICAGSIGAVITVLINFLLVAGAIFVVVRYYNRFKAKNSEPEPEADAPAEPDEVTLLREIRDELARR